MDFVLTRPSSPLPRENHTHIAADDPYSSITAFPSIFNTDHDMARDKDKPRLEILLDSQCLFLRGTGVDVEPARLSGHVALYLTESTSIKEISLQFRGKALLPAPSSEALTLNNSALTYIVCNHDWSFLEGEKKHSHTLKAGRHFFPFQLQIGGSLPSTMSTVAFGGASVAYKLRATATRPGFNHNLQAIVPIFISRSLSVEALEYQQTLEIENTWPDKIMYSIMIPHKAWAAGDKLTALVKLSPLTKGVCVLSVGTTIQEHTQLYSRSGAQEYTRIVASAKHELFGGKAVEVDLVRPRQLLTPGHSPSTPNAPLGFLPPHRISSSTTPSLPEAELSSQSTHGPDPLEAENNDIIAQLTVPIPSTITPTHALEPITVSYRIRWSIMILNPDGHTSELRCSLPLHLLDYRLLEEARSSTAAARRLLLGGPEGPLEDGNAELPSYVAHVRDRVANMFLPEAGIVRVTNPWISHGISPTYQGDGFLTNWSASHSGTSTPLEARTLSQLPHAPGSGPSTPLDWINSELLLSLSDEPPAPLAHLPTPESTTDSGSASGRMSRLLSRPGSPERQSSVSTLPVTGPNDTYLHNGNTASRTIHSIFNASMKPLSSLTHHSWLPRSSSHNSINSLPAALSAATTPPYTTDRQTSQGVGASPLSESMVEQRDALFHRAFTEVPGYTIASRGFLGGVPPLTSMHGLPSYEETQRRQAEPDPVALRTH